MTDEPPVAAGGKVVPPRAQTPLVPRPRIEVRLRDVVERRLTTVVADAGFGKTTLLRHWAAEANSAWYSITEEDRSPSVFARGLVDALRLRVPDLPSEIVTAIAGARGIDADADDLERARAFAAALSEALRERLRRDLVLVLDDLQDLGTAGASVATLGSLCRQSPPGLHIVLAGRQDVPFPIERLRGRGEVLEISGVDLALTDDEISRLMSAFLDDDASALAPAIRNATGGWPAAVRLIVEALRGLPAERREAKVASASRPGGPLFAYLAAEVFDRESPGMRSLVRILAEFERFDPDMCAALEIAEGPEKIGTLQRRGLFVEPRAGSGWLSLNELVRDFVRSYLPLDEARRREVHLGAARWFEERGHLADAVRSLETAGDSSALARLLARRGDRILSSGGIEVVLRAVNRLPTDARDARIEQLAGEALQVRGDWSGALACFERSASKAGRTSPGLAWRTGVIHYLRGEPEEALAAFGRAQEDVGDPGDRALLLAWEATTHWMVGRLKESKVLAERAFATASTADDDRALAAAHTILAMVAAWEGDRTVNDAHYLRALEHAERAGDLLQVTRIRTNRASRLMEEGDYEEALAELGIAVGLADLAGFAAIQALALSNRGETHLYLGRLEEATADLEAAKALYQRMGSRRIAGPLLRLGDVYLERGEVALARAAYEDAFAHADKASDVQQLVPVLGALARLIVDDDPERADELAQRALSVGTGLGYVGALLSAAHVAFVTGQRDRCLGLGDEAASQARLRRDRAGLAAALEMQSVSADDPTKGIELLDEAVGLWRAIGDPIGEGRAALARAGFLDPVDAGAVAREIERKARGLGARRLAGHAAALLDRLERQTRAPVQIYSLGGFRIVRDGERVPASAWQSRKARDLLKILVARRGRRVPREALMEALWPEDDPGKLANRMSVALATVRSVLDPNKTYPPDHLVAADKESVGLVLENVDVDVERFLREGLTGLELRRHNGDDDEALEQLRRAEAAYSGDFLEEDAYEDWAVALREEARACYVQVAHELATEASRRDEHDSAVRYLLRIIERDAYDERSHLELVAAFRAGGRHGEARRWYRTYASRMEEIGIEAAPFPH